MRVFPLVIAVMVPSLAAAKPLPAGWKVSVANNKLMAGRDGVSVVVFDGTSKLVKADLSDDGKTLRIVRESCMGDTDGTTPEEVSLATVDAQIENALGMKVHVKKQYAEAIKHFALAVAEDPQTSVYATNLLSAQAMSGKLDDADKVLAAAAKVNPAWIAWRLQVDPELKPLAGRPSTKLVAKPGAGKSKSGTVLYSPLGLGAVEVMVSMFDGIPDGHEDYALSIVDLATGRELLTLPTESTCGMDMSSMGESEPKPDKACEKKQAAATARTRKVADGVLAALGFETVKGGYTSVLGGDDKPEIAGSGGRKVILGDDPKLVIAGKPRELQVMGRMFAVAFVPKAVLVTYKGGKHIAGCDADGGYREEVQVEATP